MSTKKHTEGTFTITTWFRRSTSEWVGEINYISHKINGCTRVTAKTQEAAGFAAAAMLGDCYMRGFWTAQEGAAS